MGGYIVLTTKEWILSLKSLNAKVAVFWHKKKSFKAVHEGEPIYFLQKGLFLSNRGQYFVGRGTFHKHELLPANEAWRKFGMQLGFKNEQQFTEAVFKIYREHNPELGCLQIIDIDFFKEPISLNESRIAFSPYTVSGKKLSVEECQRIDKFEMEVQSGTKKII